MLAIKAEKNMKQKDSKLCWNLHALREEKNEFHLSLEPSELDLDPKGTELEGTVECNITITRNGKKVILQGDVTFSLALECARCFARFTLKREESLIAHYLAEKMPYREAEGLSNDDIMSEQYVDDTIDARQLLHDTVTLAKPMKPLCSDDCKGLCPICGQDLNTGACNCKKDNSDPRWDALKKLIK
jgi:uncharacterized protein